uniref:Putative secreted protein n=1 Tax=Ixodes ricinus TaxID=34613 RepID=A0A6B0TTM6_IXORI
MFFFLPLVTILLGANCFVLSCRGWRSFHSVRMLSKLVVRARGFVRHLRTRARVNEMQEEAATFSCSRVQ